MSNKCGKGGAGSKHDGEDERARIEPDLDRDVMEEMNFSARAHDQILKVACTLADLAGSPDIRANDILEAIQYRSLERKLFS